MNRGNEEEEGPRRRRQRRAFTGSPLHPPVAGEDWGLSEEQTRDSAPVRGPACLIAAGR